ncbi:TRMT1-like protein [Mya arenaria]|uniref:TRMT1-like protein n=1 Tax=Mya arenaria TaxID=6604 RepID=UPI0022E2BE33|nr:TRMT1-like protein [Mya arenaria]
MAGNTELKTGLKGKNKTVNAVDDIRITQLRELVLATLSMEVKRNEEKMLICLDAPSLNGEVGINWKKKFGSAVHIIMADKDDVKTLKQSCQSKSIQASDWLLEADHVPGIWPITEQKEIEVFVTPAPIQAVLHREAFSFMYLHPNQGVGLYTGSVFANLRHNGTVCFQSSDLASQCVRSPLLIQRQYQAYVQKTEYCREMALRVFIGDIARCAARYQRGIQVLYILDVRDYFLVVVRAIKSNQSALKCLDQCGHVLHCLMCQDRIPMPNTHSPVEEPYKLLSCRCKEKNPGKTGVLLGPMWLGNLVDTDYLENLLKECKKNNLSPTYMNVLNTVLVEARCDRRDMQGGALQPREKTDDRTDETKNGKGETVNTEQCGGNRLTSVPSDSAGLQTDADGKSDQVAQRKAGEGDSVKTGSNVGCVNVEKLSVGDEGKASDEGPVRKKRKLDEAAKDSCGMKQHSDMPLFYYDLQKKRFSGFPKLEKVVILLREHGFRASRTHFETQAVRTDATSGQVIEVLQHTMERKQD